jgi:hypothetical protein
MVWLRFPHLSCAPLLAYARWRGYSREETVDGARHGYWEFDRSWLMSRVFPWFLLFDAWLLALLKVYLPLARGRTVLCDRCVLDTLVDLMAGLADSHFDERLPGRCLFSPLGPPGLVVVIDLDTATCCRRSPELAGDRTHALRRALYLDLARRHGLPVISGEQAPQIVTRQILDLLASASRDPSNSALALGEAQRHMRGGL